ncbi:MAG: hypothetical protein HY361_01575 [Candidatus Aenigmarchaeota archaeon]|nr:hypothetical protein [Candidatus Aenigmarchaeota archaeon]
MIINVTPQFHQNQVQLRLSNVAVFSVNPVEQEEGELNLIFKEQIGTFSKESDLPLRAQGELIRAGTYQNYGTISKDELRKSFQALQGKKIRLFTHHAAYWDKVAQNVRNVLGWVYDFEWNEALGAIMGKTEIWDKDAALKFSQGLLDPQALEQAIGVSMGFRFKKNYQTGNLYDIEFKECSSTTEPICPTAILKSVVA